MALNSETKSIYEQWKAGTIGNFGSFHTSLLKTYMLADAGNAETLADAFPDFFKSDKQRRAEELDERIENMGDDR